MAGGDHDRRLWMVTLQPRGEPQAVMARHHHVDDRHVTVIGPERRQRFLGAADGLRLEPEPRGPARHDVADRWLVINDEDRIHWCHEGHPGRSKKSTTSTTL